MAQTLEELNQLARQLKSFHIPGQPLILTNVYDACTARLIASIPSTKVVATASYAIASSLGIEDENTMSLSDNLIGVRRVAIGLRNAGKADTVPLSADLQDGYTDPAEAVRQAIKIGVVGCNIEDVDNSVQPPTLRTLEEAKSRIADAVRGAKEAGVPDFVVNARTDVLGFEGTIDDVVERGQAYLEAGATTVFVWGAMKRVITEEEVKDMVRRLDGKLAVLAQGLTIEVLQGCGVSRISIGPTLLLKALKFLENEAKAILEGKQWSMGW
jgi:2-methylisocitrate lyase-like PEP mutase family enzyme